jgi:cytochrome c peroxidase
MNKIPLSGLFHNRKFRYVVAPLKLLAVAALGCVVSCAQGTVDKSAFRYPKALPVPAGNRMTPARVELGKMLFFDPRLSGSKWISCATCHNPAMGWSDGLPTAIGNGMTTLQRATPTIVNTAYNELQMWDGRFHSLEEQALGPMQAPGEMNGQMGDILSGLKSIPGYVQAFERAYPGEEVTKETVGKALASFERTIISNGAPFDAWVHGKTKAINASAQRGFDLFTGKANCVACHSGPNFTDEGFHNIGLNGDDLGRFAKQPIKISKGAFKTPTLRDIALTAPYMHNGEYSTLGEVIDHYDRGGDNKDNLDPSINPLGLSKQEKSDLVEFLKTLSGKQVAIQVPRLPQ